MAGIAGQGTTFNLPNYVGELFALSTEDTPFLSAIGGLTGGRPVTGSTLFQWQTYDLRAADENRQRLEGAAAPSGEARARGTGHNVVEIHQEAVELSWTKQATSGQYATNGSNHPNAVAVNGMNPVGDEMDWQLKLSLLQVARDVNRGFLVGKFANPSTNASPRKTRGIIEATATNVNDLAQLKGTATAATDGTFTLAAHGYANGTAVILRSPTGGVNLYENTLYYVRDSATNTFKLALEVGGAAITFGSTGGADVYTTVQLTDGQLVDLLQRVWLNGGIKVSETATLLTNATLKRRLTKIFITDKGYQELTRNVGGVSVDTIQTDFGRLNVMMDRYMPSGMLQVASLEQCAPRFLEIPGKGYFFEQPVPNSGSADKTQLYGEIGLEYGNEIAHGKLLGVSG